MDDMPEIQGYTSAITAQDVIQVAAIFEKLTEEYGITPPPAFSPLNGRDYRFIADRIRDDWTTSGIVSELAERNGWKRV